MPFIIGGKGNGRGGSLSVPNKYMFATTTDRDTYFTNNPSELINNTTRVIVAGELQGYNNSVWETMTPVITGPSGNNAPSIKFQYSSTGDSLWDDTLNTSFHKYWRWSTDGGSTWSPNFVRYSAASAASGIPEPYSMVVGANGKLQLLKDSTIIQEQDETGAWITQSVSTGTGSIHIGDLHSNGSAGENVLWLNTRSNIAWFPAWQGINKDDATTYELTTRKHSTLSSAEPYGTTLLTGSVDYEDTFTATNNVAFLRLDILPAESYKGRLLWESRFLPSNTEVAAFLFDVDLTGGVPYTVRLKYPLYALSGQQVKVSIKKDSGELLKVRPATANATKPYRKTYFVTFEDFLVYNQSNNALVARGLETLTDTDALDVLKLKNVGLLNKGLYRGDIPASLTGLANSTKGDWWKAASAKTVGGVTFAIGDELYCTTNTVAAPADLTNFAKVANVNQIMQASTATEAGQAGITPVPPSGDVKVLTNKGWGEAQYQDSGTGKKYILGIENGLPYLEEVV